MVTRLRETPKARTGASTHLASDGSEFCLAASAFSPGTLDANLNGLIDAPTADNLAFASLHTQKYENFHLVNGCYQKASWQPSGSSDSANFRYQGSRYDNATDAQASYNDIVNHLKGNNTSTSPDCSSQAGMTCYFITYDSQSTVYGFFFLQLNACTGETEADGSDALVNAQGSQISKTLGAIAGAAASALQSACGTTGGGPTDFDIVSVRVEKYSSSFNPDWNQARPPVKQVKVGTKVQVSVYWNLKSEPNDNPSVQYAFTATLKGHTVAQASAPGTLSSYPVDSYARTYDFKASKAGTYSFTWRVSVNGTAKQDSTSLKVRSKTQKAPPPPPPVSFNFTSIAVKDAAGHISRTFAVNQQFVIVSVYTVRNVPAGRTVPGTIIWSYQFLSNGQYKKFGGSQEDVAATNQTYRNRHTTSFTAPGSYRILVGITIGRTFRQRHYDLTLK
jgi:hypothetical protein